MPTYDYTGRCGHTSTKRGRLDDNLIVCPEMGCEEVVQRVPFYTPTLIVDRAEAPTGSEDANDTERKALRSRGWDGDRAMDEIRKNMVEGPDGQRHLNMAGISK